MKEIILTRSYLANPKDYDKPFDKILASDFYISQFVKNKADIIVFVDGFNSKVFKFKENNNFVIK
jgi:hypothetical protein